MGKEKTLSRKPERKRRRVRGSDYGKVRKGLGACIFTLGIPLVVAGTILLIVANSKSEDDEVPSSFPVLGPVLIVTAILCFAVGSIMTEMISVRPCVQFCFPDDPKNFCWKRCPGLYALLRPNEVSLLNRRDAGLHALQSVPSKPVLKKPSQSNVPTVRRGVRFSDSDCEVVKPPTSVSSETSETQKGDNSPNTSLLSLRHCRIYPKEGERFGSMASEPVEEEEGEGEEVVFTLSGSVAADQDVFLTDPDTEHVTEIDLSDSSGQSNKGQDPDQTRIKPTDQVVTIESEHF